MTYPDTFTPRRAIVTGGSSGIGQATCVALAKMGCDVGLTFRSDEDGARKTAQAVRKAGRTAAVRALDLTDPEAAAEVVDDLADDLGGVDVFVANAGVSFRGDILDMTLEDWHANTVPDLDGGFTTMQRAARRMARDGVPGAIVAVTSVHEHVPQPGGAAYTAAKHGLGGLVKVMAVDLARYGIRVNAVAPGEIATKMNAMDERDVPHTERPRIPAKRPGYAWEVAHVIAFLCSSQATYVSGASWTVDGGFERMTALASSQYRDEA